MPADRLCKMVMHADWIAKIIKFLKYLSLRATIRIPFLSATAGWLTVNINMILAK